MQRRDPDRPSGWEAYYAHHTERPISLLLGAALKRLSPQASRRQAIDLGCGSGNETRGLLEAGWDVVAIDQERAAIERVNAIRAGFPGVCLETRTQQFESLATLPAASLIHAGMSIPFCHPRHFEKFWAQVRAALLPGGLFVGQLFGNRDDWAGDPSRTFHSEAQARGLFQGLDLISFEAHEYDGSSLRGSKHWHRFEVIAQRPAPHA